MSWYCRQCGPVALAAGANYRAQRCPTCAAPLELDRRDALDGPVAFECPRCAREVDASATRCRACSAYFGAPRCERCRAPLRAEAARCDGCGALAPPPWSAAPSAPACPICDGVLAQRAVGGVEVLACELCRGVFAEPDVVERWTADRAAAAPDVDLFDARVAFEESAVRYRRCPRCASVMNRVNFAPGSGVVVDVCRAHGTWFDPGELPRVLAFARGGGLEAARRRAAEERRREARARAEASARAGAFLAGRGERDPAPELTMFLALLRRIFRG